MLARRARAASCARAVLGADGLPAAPVVHRARAGRVPPGAVDDVRAEEVVQGRGERVHQAGEGPHGEQRHAPQHVHVEARGRGGHGAHVRLQDPQRAEPRGDRLAVVHGGGVEHGEHRGGEPCQQGAHEHHVHELVVVGGGHEHGTGQTAAHDQQHQAHKGAHTGHRADGQRQEVVRVLGHAHGLGPGLGDHQAHDVSRQHGQDAEVEQRGRDAQQTGLVELRGAGGPPELVVLVAPDQPAHQGQHDHVRQDSPEQDVDHVHGFPPVMGSRRGS